MSNDYETVEISNCFIGNYVIIVCYRGIIVIVYVHAEINTNMYVERICWTLEH